jgi:PAS domain S-box-containing protein
MTLTQSTTANKADKQRHPNRFAQDIWKPLLAFTLFALVITAGGYWFFHRYKENITTEKQNDLGGIAELKIGQIGTWIAERRGDAQALKEDPLFVSAAAAWLERKGEANEHKTNLSKRLLSMQQAYAAYGYTSISLFDKNGKLSLSSSAQEEPLQGAEAQQLLQSLRTGQIYFSDIHFEKHRSVEVVEIDLIAPLQVIRGGRQRTIGAVLFRIDPHRFLFPLIQHWPTPSASAENLLVRRDGDQVLFLNELRHRKNTVLAMRLPLDSQLPAAMAIRGQEGLVDGVDYRGVPVVGVLNKVAGTSWLMVSKVDKAEIYAPINKLSKWMVLLMLGLIGAGGAIVFYWRENEKRQYENELKRQSLSKHLEYLGKYASDIIMLLDRDGRIVDFNGRALQEYGFSDEEFSAMNIDDLIDTNIFPSFTGQLHQVNRTGVTRFEAMHVRKNGEYFPVECGVRLVEIEGNDFYQAIILDITERKLAEMGLKRLNRALRLLSASNAQLVHAENEAQLIAVCKLIVEMGGYSMVWVGYAEHDENKTVRPVMQYGFEHGYLESIHISWADTESGRGPTGTAIRSGQAQINQNFLTNATTAAWRKEALARGYQSSIALPLKNEAKVFGALNIYSAELFAFNADEVELLQELADNLAYGMSMLHLRDERQQAVEKLRQSEERFRFLTENASDMVFLMSLPDLHFNYVSPASTRLFGYTPQEFYDTPGLVRTFIHSDSKHYLAEQTEKLLAGEAAPSFEYSITHRSGEKRWMSQRNSPVWSEGGEKVLVGIQGVVTDITERKLAQEQFENEHTQLRTLVQTIPDMVWLKDTNGVYLSCNPQFERFFGAKEADIIGKTDFDFVDAQLAETFRQKDREATAAGKPSTNEEWVTYPDNGSRVLLETIKVPTRNEAGELIGVMGIARDITERKHAEERESRLRHILDSALDMIFIFQPDTLRFVYMNKGALDSVGYSVEEMLLMSPPDIAPLLTEAEFRAFITPLISGEKNMLRFESIHRHKDGSDLPVEVQLQLVREKNGEQVFVAIVRDISERRRAERELQRQKAFMWKVIDIDPNRIFVKDAQGNFLLVNKGAAAAFGMTPFEMIGKNLADLNSAAGEVAGFLADDREVIEQGREVNLVAPITMADGEQRWMLTIKRPLIMPDGKLSVLGIAVDITQQKRAEIELADSYKELQRLSLHFENIRAEERAKIALNLHDEMGATLVAIKMGVSWLASKLPADAPKLSNEVAHITGLVSGGIHTLRQIVTQLRPNLLDDVGLAAAIKDYVKKFQKHTNIKCVLALPNEELPLDADQSLTIFRILQESLNNVAKHAHASRVDILLTVQGESLLLVVKDNGIGFDPAENKKRTFGLLGIRERALMVGGKARISSTRGKGMRVSVTIPFLAGTENA